MQHDSVPTVPGRLGGQRTADKQAALEQRADALQGGVRVRMRMRAFVSLWTGAAASANTARVRAGVNARASCVRARPVRACAQRACACAMLAERASAVLRSPARMLRAERT